MLKMIPNILTIGRIVLTVLFLAMLLYYPTVKNKQSFMDTAFVLFVITCLTDLIDGPIARALNVVSKFGRILDPLADKVLVCGAFICLALIGEPKLFDWPSATLKIIHWATAGIIIAREIYVTILRHIAEASGINFAATFSGKIKMFLQSVTVGVILIKIAHFPTPTWASCTTSTILLITLAVTIVSGIRATQRILAKQPA
jgi:CDP-diacylglycerol--glycerol-3-phosphate 3-phosphatidyltransferase